MNVAYQQQGVPPTDQQKLEQLCRFLQEALSSADECNRSNQLEQLKAAVLTINDSLFVSFFERVKNLQHNPSIPIRLFVLDFLRIGCVRHPQLLITSAPCILHMARTDSPAVKIMLLLVMSEVYPLCLRFMAKPEHGLLAELDKTFQVLSEVKMALLPLLNSDSEGTRLYAIRFVSKCILITTDASVINSPNVQQCLNGTTLLADGRGLFERLIEMLSSPSTTSSTLIVLLDILLRIVSERSAWIGEFLEKCRVLYENLPPTLSKSQTRSVQKMIRLQLQHFTSSTAGRSHERYHNRYAKKRVLRPAEHSCDASVNPDPRKRSKREDVPPIGEETASAGLGGSANDEPADITNGLIDYIQERLTPSCIVDLVIAATATWPNQMLPGFMSQYDPKKLLQCTEVNKRVLCRRIAELLKQRNLLPRIGYEAPEREKAPPVDELNSSVAPKAPGSSRRQGLLGVKDRVKDAVVSSKRCCPLSSIVLTEY
uniref:DUF3453 domain-containing protein n=1 Tax=Trichuris muris TaxID=70415 RepID=A0A5S6Q3E9_TRIMR